MTQEQFDLRYQDSHGRLIELNQEILKLIGDNKLFAVIPFNLMEVGGIDEKLVRTFIKGHGGVCDYVDGSPFGLCDAYCVYFLQKEKYR